MAPRPEVGFLLVAHGLLFLAVVTSALDKGEVLDMSYAFGDTTLYWPGLGSFEMDILSRGPSGDIPWFEANSFSGAEHGGTHLDSPAHLSQGQLRVDAIPVDKFVGPALRVDIADKANVNEDYQLTAQDLQDWEGVHGRIPDGSLLFVYTGWGAFYPDRLAYFGSARNDTYLNDQGESLLHFPGVAPEAATWLVENRKISGLGIDTASMDYGQSTVFMSHQILFGANIYGMENVANLDRLPNTGAKVHALPMKIKDGSGAPIRITAMLDEECTSGAAMLSPAKAAFVALLGLALFVLKY
ncbi:isatin hydrolase-like [Patiria miniata]|uniref:Kynurenine formamidase n=1 Tax=Patiria miniata TaxID=46514 RepID=A0A914ALB0_PATMI|nr:isatin hydrolase-like [Patiria miniata]XP_038064351.1 isatin hydrolase-like [Patiria miniata]